jgi:hypothetical protein
MVWACRKDGERRLTKEIYEEELSGSAVSGRPRQTFIDQIGQVLETRKR